MLSLFLTETARRFGILEKLLFVSTDNASNAKASVRLAAEDHAVLCEIGEEAEEDTPNTCNEVAALSALSISEKDGIPHDLLEDIDAFIELESATTVPDLLIGDPQSVFNAFIENADNPFSVDHPSMGTVSDTPLPCGTNAQSTTQVTLNRMACMAHTLQLSVKSSLNHESLQKTIENVRITCRFFRKSEVGGRYLRVELKASKLNFTRLLLDVATRWGSTLAMLRRFLACYEEVSKAVRRLLEDKVEFKQLKPGTSPASSEIHTLRKCVEALKSVEQATAILGAERAPTTHIADTVVASVIKRQLQLLAGLQEGSPEYVLCSNLRDSILRRRFATFKDCKMSALYVQVATILTPAYVKMRHMRFLTPHTRATEDAIFEMALIAKALRKPGVSPPAVVIPDVRMKDTATAAPHPLMTDSAMEDSVLGSSNQFTSPSTANTLREKVLQEFKLYEVLAIEFPSYFPLHFWKLNAFRLPLLAEVACIALTPPATSVPSERVFSTAGWIRETRRSRLTPKNTELLVKTGHYVRLHGVPDGVVPSGSVS